MGDKELQKIDKRADLEYIQSSFKVNSVIEHLHNMSMEITKQEVNYKNINAACNCIQQLNSTIDTAIRAARFLRE